jgi:hypothetical protein
VLSKELSDVRIDVLGDTAIAFFISDTKAKLRAHTVLHELDFRVSTILHRTVGWLRRLLTSPIFWARSSPPRTSLRLGRLSGPGAGRI